MDALNDISAEAVALIRQPLRARIAELEAERDRLRDALAYQVGHGRFLACYIEDRMSRDAALKLQADFRALAQAGSDALSGREHASTPEAPAAAAEGA